jgi:hypothetical protein
MPEASTAITTSGYVGATEAAAIPTPARATPPGRSHSAPRASDQRPKAGWTREELIVAASAIAPTIVYERSNLVARNGRRAGSAP